MSSLIKTCPYCKQQFTAKKKHPHQKFCSTNCRDLARKHKIPPKSCPECSNKFVSRNKYCSFSCAKKHFGHRQRTEHYIDCLCCGKSFHSPPSDKDRKFCSQDCQWKYQGNRRKQRLSKTCELCGKSFVAKKISVRFCSRSCAVKSHKVKTPKACDIMTRDMMLKCTICGYNRYPAILERHHIDGDSNNHMLENLMVICPNCHSEIHFKKGTGRFATSYFEEVRSQNGM